MTSIDHSHIHPSLPAGAQPVTPASRLPTALGDADRALLEQHLQRVEIIREPSWAMLAHVLRHKILTAERLTGPAPDGLVTGETWVTYMVSGGMAETVFLTHGPVSEAPKGAIAVASLLGATLIGMRALHRAPMLREDGSVVTLAVLRASAPDAADQQPLRTRQA